MRKFLIVLFFISIYCFTNQNSLLAQDYQNQIQRVDTAKSNSFPITAKPEIFENAFLEGTETMVDTILIQFYSVNIGKIEIESGKIMASTPWGEYDLNPFKTQFPIGYFPVQLAISKFHENEFVAFSRILFSDNPVERWEFALKEGQKQISIFGDSRYFDPIDGGIGQFIDDNSYNNFQALDKDSKSQVMDSLSNELMKRKNFPWLFANINCKKINIVAFSTGFGDGRYTTYIGFDKEGSPCRLLTDFELIDWRK